MAEHNAADVFPPGEYIRDELEAREWTQTTLAAIMGRPVQTVNEIVNGKKRITPQTAQELARAFGTSAEFWMNLEASYRLALAKSEGEDVELRARLFSLAPINILIKRQWIEKSATTKGLELELKRFFEAPSLDQIPKLNLAARMSASYGGFTPAQKAWGFRAKKLARAVNAAKFSDDRFREGLAYLHRFTASEHDIRRVPRLLAELGVRLVIVQHLPGTRIDGATFWLDDETPAVAISLRYGRIDSFWYTLAHELMHVKHRDPGSLDSDLVGNERQPTEEKDEIERRADTEATDFLVPSSEMEGFILRMQGRFSKVGINRFANRIQIHPGIIAGQLHHRFREFSHYRDMLPDIRQDVLESALSDGWGVCPPVK